MVSPPRSVRAGFNSRSRVGSDLTLIDARYRTKVSIHAPAWGATQGIDNPFIDSGSFNSRSRVGSDTGDRRPHGRRPVSIHAPAWGATPPASSSARWSAFQFTLPRGERLPCGQCIGCRLEFQFTLPRGERRDVAYPLGKYWVFQFTLPRGERRQSVGDDPRAARFNSRSRVGSDRQAGEKVDIALVSIHAPAWGATPSGGERVAPSISFNSRSRMGSD